MRPSEITEEDRYHARERALYTCQKFRDVLRKDLFDCLDGREFVPISEFVEFFNRSNVVRGHKTLNTHHVKVPAYFEALDDVCRVDRDYTRLYPVTRESRSQSVNPRPRHIVIRPQILGPPSGIPQSPPKEPEDGSRSPPSTTLRGGRSLSLSPTLARGSHGSITINQLQRILIDFTHRHSRKNILWTDYCSLLSDHDPSALERFRQMKPTEAAQFEFVRSNVSGAKNVINIEGSGPTAVVAISDCSCCRQQVVRVPRIPLLSSKLCSPGSVEDILNRFFRKVELPMREWVEVHVADVDCMNPKLRLTVVWKNSAFEEFHERLRNSNRNNFLGLDELYAGDFCIVPFEGTKDYHRGIVKDVTEPLLPVIYYVDLGIERKVARDCIRQWNMLDESCCLKESFSDKESFCLEVDLCDSPAYNERVRIGHKLIKKGTVTLKVVKDDKWGRTRPVVVLDADSGIASDASRD